MPAHRRLVWFKSTDLRIHDNPVLQQAHTHTPDCKHHSTAPSQSKTDQLASYDKLRAFLNNNHTDASPPPSHHDSSGCTCDTQVLHVFVFDPIFIGGAPLPHTQAPKMNVLRIQFLLHTLIDLQRSLRQLGSDLYLAYGGAADVLQRLCKQYNINSVYTSAVHTTDELNIQRDVRSRLTPAVQFHELWMNSMIDIADCPFKYGDGPNIFTSFRTQVEKQMKVHDWTAYTVICNKAPLLSSVTVNTQDDSMLSTSVPGSTRFGVDQATVESELQRHDAHKDLSQPIGGESAALAHLHQYMFQHKLAQTYKQTRNGMLTTTQFSTKFSPWLAQGALSARLIYWAVKHFEQTVTANDSTYWIIFELLWRDYWRLVIAPKFAHNLFTKYGIKSVLNVKETSDYIEPGWSQDEHLYKAWRDGRTGHALVDACMRELRTVGWMSNRGRQIVASFLTKDMGIDWRMGAEWFESQLIDYDCASNWGNWEYAAGVGTDPRAGRYFSLHKQGKQYDPDGAYVRYWLKDDYVNGSYNVPKVCQLRFDASHNSHSRPHNDRKNGKHYGKQKKTQSRGFASSAALHSQS